MVKQVPVNVNWQSLFVIIPVVDLWAAYRIEKLRLYLLFIIAFTITEVTVEGMIFGFDVFLEDAVDSDRYVLQVLFIALSMGIAVALIRKWSKEWNAKVAGITQN